MTGTGQQLDEEKGTATTAGQSQLSLDLQIYQDRLNLARIGKVNISCLDYIIEFICWLLYIISFPCFFPCSFCGIGNFKTVQVYQRAVNFRMGKIEGVPKGPGRYFVMPCINEFYILDMRTMNYDIPLQSIITKDSVTLLVDGVVFYRVFDPILAIANVTDWENATRLLAATTLRNALGTKSLTDLLTENDALASQMREELDEATDPWGVTVERVAIKNIVLPAELLNSMAAEAQAMREAKAKVIAAEAEVISARALKDAANTLFKSPGAFQLRSIQVMEEVSTTGSSFIVILTNSAEVFK